METGLRRTLNVNVHGGFNRACKKILPTSLFRR